MSRNLSPAQFSREDRPTKAEAERDERGPKPKGPYVCATCGKQHGYGKPHR